MFIRSRSPEVDAHRRFLIGPDHTLSCFPTDTASLLSTSGARNPHSCSCCIVDSLQCVIFYEQAFPTSNPVWVHRSHRPS